MANEPDTNEQYERLIQLLALKRYEQPPPGFFDRFPREVRLRIVGETNPQAGWASHLSSDSNWFSKLMIMLDTRPYLAGVFGVLACGFVITGILYANSNHPPTNTLALESFTPIAPAALVSDSVPAWAAAGPTGSSTNPMPNLMPAMLWNGSGIQSQPATLDFSKP